MSVGPRLARGFGIGLVLAALALLAWALKEPAPAVEPDRGEARALAAQHEVERGEWRGHVAELTGRVTELEGALASAQELRFAREREWLEFTQLLGSLDIEGAPPIPEFLAPDADSQASSGVEGGGTRSDGPSEVDPAAAAAERVAAANLALDVRGRAMRTSLGALLTAEQVGSLDFRELGRPHTFEGRGVVGPVVARFVDDRGWLTGNLFAERLWIEVSRSARCVTLVLEDGYEMHGGVREPFETSGQPQPSSPSASEAASGETAAPAERAGAALRGVRRIFLSSVDPEPWLEALPEIIDQAPSVAPIDDGVYDLTALRIQLNELLRKAGTEAGEGWRFHVLGGVQSNVLRDVQLVEHAADGSVSKRLFADRLEVHRTGRSIDLVLEGGSQERNGRLAPFLEGRYRVSLPRARAEDWIAAGIPGAARTR